VHIKKTWVSGGIPPRILKLGTRCRWVVGLVLRQLYLRERTPGAHWIGRWVGPTHVLDDLERWRTFTAAGSRLTISRSSTPWPGHCTHLVMPSNKDTAELVYCSHRETGICELKLVVCITSGGNFLVHGMCRPGNTDVLLRQRVPHANETLNTDRAMLSVVIARTLECDTFRRLTWQLAFGQQVVLSE
jgi:hypothetical protein